MEQQLFKLFETRFHTAPQLLVKAPGRANIIGEHTDYNNGLVLPFAINRFCVFVAGKTKENYACIESVDLEKSTQITLDNLPQKNPSDWTRYFVMALKVLEKYQYQLKGFQCMLASDIPIGAGLSSSSAITCGFIAMLNDLFQLHIPKEKQIRLASEAENGTGVQGGMMDQYAIVMSQKNYALLLDCLDFSIQLIPNKIEGAHWVFIDSQVKHNLANTGYNSRRKDCAEGFKIIKNNFKTFKNIRELNEIHLECLAEYPIYQKRLQYIQKENERVKTMVAALVSQNLKKVGELLTEGHWDLSKNYEVSCEKLDFLALTAQQTQGVYGARMMGGGFGGGIITLIDDSHKNAATDILKTYQKKYGQGALYLLNSVAGIETKVVTL